MGAESRNNIFICNMPGQSRARLYKAAVDWPGFFTEWREKMLDVAYVVGTIVFFVLVDLLGKAVDKL